MSPAARETLEAAPFTWCNEEKILCQVAIGKMTAHDAARVLTPTCMDRNDSAVIKMEQAAIESIEFYRDLYATERYHDREVLITTSDELRRIWDRLK